jgi:hypothetical protein
MTVLVERRDSVYIYTIRKKKQKKGETVAAVGAYTKAHLLNEGAGRYLVLCVLIP